MKRVGVDIGGTHTDLVLIDTSGDIVVEKAPTSTSDPSRAAVAALGALTRRAGCDMADIDWFMHGTTIATNIILQRNGAKTGLITTEGFRDVLHIARHKRPLNFSLQLDLPWQTHQLIARRHRKTVAERVTGPDGAILTPLDEAAARIAARELIADGVEAIAVCFLFSFLNPVHERRVGEIIREEAPDVHISLSHEVVPQYREYERFSTTALNAFVAPKTAVYLQRLDGALKSEGLRTGLHLMQSSGGAATVDAAVKRPVTLLMSGPVGGLLGGIWAGQTAGFRNVITLDVGGTSADIGVAPDGEMQFKHLLDTRIASYDAMVPMAEVDSIGAGGGSIAYVDPAGQFQVGPKSAGAEPGPSCYGRGGVEATATDCALVLGLIDPNSFLGGRMRLDATLAERAVDERLAGPLGLSREEAALGAIGILTHTMVQAIEMNSVRKGYDPRDFALVAFGGAGGLFACETARDLGTRTVIIPPLPGLTSAIGLLTSDISYDYGRTIMRRLGSADPGKLEAAWGDLVAQAKGQLDRDGLAAADTAFLRFADCRYVGQGYELRVRAPAGAVNEDFMAGLRAAFHQTHQRIYGTMSPDKEIEVVNIRLVGVGRVASVEPTRIASGGVDPSAAKIGERRIVTGLNGASHARTAAIFDRARLKAGNRIQGPAIIQQMDSTTVLPFDLEARVDNFANLIIEFS